MVIKLSVQTQILVRKQVLYRGPDASQKMLECLPRESKEIQEHLKNIKPLLLSIRNKMLFSLRISVV